MRGPRLAVAATASGAALLALVAPYEVVLGMGPLAAWVVAAAGAWLVIGRVGAVDLSLAASLGAGAYAGGVLPAYAGWPPLTGLLLGVAAGAAVGAGAGLIGGRVGRTAGALATLAYGLAVVAALGAVAAVGGRAGFHAVALLTGSDRGDALVAVIVAGATLVAATRIAATTAAARASVAARRPDVAAAYGRRPAVTVARMSAVAGALLGLAGTLQAALGGSVAPAAYGLAVTAGLVLAALLGGAAPLGPLLGAVWVWGPSIVLPLAPVLGSAPPLLTTGPAGLLVASLRRGRPLAGPHVPPAPATAPGPADVDPATAAPTGATETPAGAPLLAVAATTRTPALALAPGEIVGVLGPNGAGKSTLLARIGGQLPDGGGVALAGTVAPRGPVARARAGLARTWQQPPDVPPGDLLALARDPAADVAAPDAAGAGADADAGPDALPDVARVQLRALESRRPTVALLDEPGASLPASEVAATVRRLAAGGTAVLLVDHRAEVMDVADRVLPLPGVVAAPSAEADGAARLPSRLPVSPPAQRRMPGLTIPSRDLALDPGGAVLLAADDELPAQLAAGLLAVRIGRREVTGMAALARHGIAVVGRADVADDVSVADHLAARLRRRDAQAVLAALPLLAGRGADRAGVLSGGERRLLAWACALVLRPSALVLDHAGEGLDPEVLRHVTAAVRALRDAGAAIVVRPGRAEEAAWAAD